VFDPASKMKRLATGYWQLAIFQCLILQSNFDWHNQGLKKSQPLAASSIA